MSALDYFDAERQRAKEAREMAHYLRNLFRIATCGLPMKFVGYHYGTQAVRQSIAMRVADMYLIWADEYDVIANEIERRLTDALGDGV